MSDQGITIGLQLWLFFLVCFVLLDYPIPLSLCLGAAAGIAASLIITWWQAPTSPNQAEAIPETAISRLRSRISLWRSARQGNRNRWFRPSSSVYQRRRSRGESRIDSRNE
ncbi:MAG: hypothetical protein ACTS2F_15470 [Thainema sp.]